MLDRNKIKSENEYTYRTNRILTAKQQEVNMQDRNKIKSENEYTYRTNRINCCNNNYIPSLNTVFHLASFPVDEINEGELWQ
mgnify:CR=1 FL=1